MNRELSTELLLVLNVNSYTCWMEIVYCKTKKSEQRQMAIRYWYKYLYHLNVIYTAQVTRLLYTALGLGLSCVKKDGEECLLLVLSE